MRKQEWIRFCLAVFLLLGLLAAIQPAWSQEVTASITGTVTDPSGAALAGATVTAKSVERGLTYSAQTNDSGIYRLSQLPVGSYELKAEKAGFSTVAHPAFVLTLNQVARIDIGMKVGQVSETVEVTGAAPVLQTESTQVSTVIDSRSADTLPLATRNYVQLTLLSPGSVTPNPGGFNNGDNTANGARPYINGNREQANNFILDGVDNNQVSDNLLGYTPAPDAIQEFNLITNNASAQFGNFQGGIVNTTIKSGTNSFHGDAWEFFRNDVLNANSWENKFLGSGHEVPRAKLRWNMFGGTIGGPIIKNKLFFFGDYQGQRFDHPSTGQFISVFTAAERGGDFGALCKGFDSAGLCMDRNSKGQVINQLYNPCTGVTRPCVFNTGTRAFFPFNRIPLSMIDPVAQNLFNSSVYPTPINGSQTNNALNTQAQAFNNNQFDVKIDFNATQKDHVFGRYTWAHQENPTTNSLVILGDGFAKAPIQNLALDWSHTVGTNMVNDARFGINYIKLNNGVEFPSSAGNIGEQLGIANANTRGPGLFLLGFNGGTPSNAGTGTLRNIGDAEHNQNFRDAVFQFTDNVDLTHGHHTFHMGFEYWRYRINTYYAGNSGRIGGMLYGGNFTSNNPVNTVSGTGFGGADFFLGFPDATGQGIDNYNWYQRSNTIAGYVQDDWRATSNLTLNLGLRYQAYTPWVEKNDHQVNFGLFSGQLMAPNCALVTGVSFSCQNGTGALYNGVYGIRAFQPRIGFAWTPEFSGGKTVIRGAYTVSTYLEGTGTNLRLAQNPPFSPTETLNQFNGTALPTTSAEGIVTPPPGDPFKKALLRVWDPDVQPAMSQQWNLTIQQQLSNSTTFQIGYVGQHGTHLMVPMPYLQRQLLPNSACAKPPCTAPSLYFSGNPALQSDISQISGTASVGTMKYNALQAVLQKRYTSGLQYQVAYTYSKCMTDNSGYYGSWGAQASPANPYYQNLYNPHADYAPCYYDSTHVLSAYLLYDIPVGRGRKFGNNMNSVVNAVIGGWSVDPILSTYSGFPLALYNFGNDPTGTNSRGLRPDCGSGAGRTFGRQKAFDPKTGNFIGYQWYDPTPYTASGVGQFGNCPAQGPVRGPNYVDLDLSLQKNFPITETMRFQFRTDFLNAFNHVNLNVPASNAIGSGMGLINTSQSPRNIQFALKFYF